MRTAEAYPASVPRRRPMHEAATPAPTGQMKTLRRSVGNGGRSFMSQGFAPSSGGEIPAHSDHRLDAVGWQVTIPQQDVFNRASRVGCSQRGMDRYVVRRTSRLPRFYLRPDFFVLFHTGFLIDT